MDNALTQMALRQALREARTALARDVDGDLPLPQRRRVWLALGLPYGDVSSEDSRVALK